MWRAHTSKLVEYPWFWCILQNGVTGGCLLPYDFSSRLCLAYEGDLRPLSSGRNLSCDRSCRDLWRRSAIILMRGAGLVERGEVKTEWGRSPYTRRNCSNGDPSELRYLSAPEIFPLFRFPFTFLSSSLDSTSSRTMMFCNIFSTSFSGATTRSSLRLGVYRHHHLIFTDLDRW